MVLPNCFIRRAIASLMKQTTALDHINHQLNILKRPHSSLRVFSLPKMSDTQRRPIILMDVMDTIVTDPFYSHMASYFGISFEEVGCT